MVVAEAKCSDDVSECGGDVGMFTMSSTEGCMHSGPPWLSSLRGETSERS